MAVYPREPTTNNSDEPMYVISVAARLVEMHPQTLRYYERAGLVKPKRSRGSIRLYSQRDIERLRKIARLVDNLGVNLAGVEVILHLTEKLELLQRVLEQYQIELPNDLQAESDELLGAEPPTAPAAPDGVPVRITVRRPHSKSAETETKKSKRSIRNVRNNDGTLGAR
jgi:MerR family transcriptional regulator/heat shock protein HspR